MPSIAIEAVELTKHYGPIEALKGLSFAIPQGEIVAFLGPNSAGKTTTLKILAGLLPASSGQATVAGFSPVYDARQVKRHIGYMPEHNPLPDEATIEEFLNYRAQLKELRGGKIKERIAAVTKMCDLTGKILKRPILALSRGVRQRVGIADALLTDPPVLILDEPTIGLDPHQVISLRDLVRSMRGAHTILLSTHILSEAEAIADRVLIINKGQKVAFGTPAELRAQYGSADRISVDIVAEAKEVTAVALKMGAVIEKQTLKGSHGRYVFALKAEKAQEFLLALGSIKGAQMSEFVCQKPTLEDIFIQATQGQSDL